MAGGAITSEGSYLTIDNSTFNTGKGSYVQESGGLIQVVGKGEFHLKNSTLNGSGVGWNATGANKTAKFGGAIVFYDDSTVKATIENTTIQNFTAEISGGGIALNTQIGKGEKSAVNLTLIDTKILNNVTYAWNMTAYGGGIFVGKGNTVTMEGGQISSDQYSSVGGAIYNEGKLTLTKSNKGNALIKDNKAYHMAAGVLNDGYLKVDFAEFSGNKKGDGYTGEGHVYDENKKELPGVNIYAVKDVIITPNAQFDDKDVRIIEKNASGETSKILLTGPLTKQINVSISEKPKTGSNDKFIENQKRRIGYVVAEGTNGYAATKNDAKKLHYLSKAYDESKPADDANQPIAKAADDTSPGMWDFVLDKENGKVVVGQRVKLIYHGNLGKIGSVDKEEKTVDVYKNPNFWEDQLADYKVADPARDKYDFMGWYYWKDESEAVDTVETIQDIKKPDGLKGDLFDFSRVTFENNVENTDKIITPNVINTYAGWSENIELSVSKKWVDAEEADKVNVTVTLKGGDEDKTVTLTGARYYSDSFTDLPVFTKSYEPNEEKNMNLKFTPREYSVVETPIAGFTTSYNPDKLVANQVGEINSYFTVTNTKIKTGNVFVKYVAEDGTVLEAESKVVENAKVGTDYTTEQKTFDGYEYSAMGEGSAAASGKVVAGDLHVTYVYKAKTGNVFVKYVTEDGKVLEAESKVVENAKVGTAYATTQKTFDGYEFSKMGEDSAPANGTVKEGDLYVIYVYKMIKQPEPKTGNVYVEYKAEDGTVLEAEKVVKTNAPVGEAYTTEKKAFKGYEFSKMGENSAEPNGNVVAGDLHVIYVYKKTESQPPTTKVITQYVDENGNRLIPDRAGKQPVVEIKDYTYLRTEESDTLIRHIYKKIQEPVHPSGSVLILPTPGTSEPVPDDGLLNKKDHKAYMFGYPDGNFLPERNMTREEATAMFARLLKDYPRERRSYTIPFKDVAESDWSQQAIGFMLEKGMIQGYEDGSFRPKAAISRAEFAAMAARFDKLVAGTGNPFSDVPDTHWAQGAIDSAAAKGWVTGYPDGSFKPERKITRAEVVNITNKMLDRFADRDFVRSHLSEMIQFKDLTEADWAYFPIMEATNGHDYTRKAAQEENWIRLNGEEFRFVVVGRK